MSERATELMSAILASRRMAWSGLQVTNGSKIGPKLTFRMYKVDASDSNIGNLVAFHSQSQVMTTGHGANNGLAIFFAFCLQVIQNKRKNVGVISQK